MRRMLLLIVCAVLVAGAPVSAQTLSTIAFGSCAGQFEPQPIWDAVVAADPDVFLFIGDNIYADTEDMTVMREKYDTLGSIPGYRRLKLTCPILATWDDHDFGLNDAGSDYSMKDESQKEFRRFFGPPRDPSREGKPGVYDAAVFGPEGKRTQIILLDTRYFRSPLYPQAADDPMSGPYGVNLNPSATILGEDQWAWLEQQLRVPAELRIIASSIQVIPQDHGWEKWMNFPKERERLYKLLKDTGAAGVLFISGDRHLAELSMMDAGIGYPLFDLTSSSLNRSAKAWRFQELNRHRLGTMNWGDNFGVIKVDWDREDPLISMQIRDVEGDTVINRKIPLSILQPGVIK